MVTIEPFKKFRGIVAPLPRSNVDTDAIIPKQFLKRVKKSGFGKYLFYEWRYQDNGQLNPDFILNQSPYDSASILLTRDNFGCGSSREHAPWALKDFGFKTIIAPSFADIFYNNCFKNGILPIKLPTELVAQLFEKTEQINGYSLTIDLAEKKLRDESGMELDFVISADNRNMLLKGLDHIDITLKFEKKITAYENSDKAPISIDLNH